MYYDYSSLNLLKAVIFLFCLFYVALALFSIIKSENKLEKIACAVGFSIIPIFILYLYIDKEIEAYRDRSFHKEKLAESKLQFEISCKDTYTRIYKRPEQPQKSVFVMSRPENSDNKTFREVLEGRLLIGAYGLLEGEGRAYFGQTQYENRFSNLLKRDHFRPEGFEFVESYFPVEKDGKLHRYAYMRKDRPNGEENWDYQRIPISQLESRYATTIENVTSDIETKKFIGCGLRKIIDLKSNEVIAEHKSCILRVPYRKKNMNSEFTYVIENFVKVERCNAIYAEKFLQNVLISDKIKFTD